MHVLSVSRYDARDWSRTNPSDASLEVLSAVRSDWSKTRKAVSLAEAYISTTCEHGVRKQTHHAPAENPPTSA